MNDEAEPKAPKADKGPALTRKILIERVQAASGVKIKDVRAVVEATLAVMGDALKAGEALKLPPFGMGRPKKGKEGAEPTAPKMLLKASTKTRAPKPPKAPKAAKPEGAAKAGAKAGGRGKGAGAGGKAAGAKGAGAKGRRAGKKAKEGVETPGASE